MTGEIILPSPHKGQKIVRQQARRFNWVSAGRRWRKTTLGMAIVIEGAVRGESWFWGAPTYDQVRIGWNEAKYACRDNAEFKMSTMTATFPTGGQIIYRSLDDPDNARGHTFKGAIFDEVGDIKEDAYYNVIMPILGNDENSMFWGLGTPRGRNYFWREFTKAKGLKDSVSWQIPTLGCKIVGDQLVREPHPLENTDYPWSEVVRQFESMPQSEFRQEILAEFLKGEGAVFRNIRACMNAPLNVDPRKHKGHYIVAGVDWGKQNDFTTISVGCADCRVEIARDRFNRIDYHFQRKRLVALWQRFGINKILVELNAMGEPNFEELQLDGLPVVGFRTTASSKPPLITSLALAFEKEEWQFQADEVWTLELEAYEQKVNPRTSRSSYSAPEGLHDDTVIARALMVSAAYQPRFQVIEDPFDEMVYGDY